MNETTNLSEFVGRRVSYSDVANPWKCGTVIKTHKRFDRLMLVLVFDDLQFMTVSKHMVDSPGGWNWENRDRRRSRDECIDLEERAAAEHERRQAEREATEKRHEEERRIRVATIMKACPNWAKSAIVAELEQDDCDTMSDYFATSTQRRVVIGWSKHCRNLFSEMRKIAGRFEDTKHLVSVGKKAEHRENYSMGRGNYLKDADRYNNGWMVSKVRIRSYTDPDEFCFDMLLDAELADYLQ